MILLGGLSMWGYSVGHGQIGPQAASQSVEGYGGGNGQGTISGMKFNDLNANGVKDEGEEGLAGWTITIYKTPDFGHGIRTMVTDANGHYEWDNVPYSNYVLCETPQDGWNQTFPTTSGYQCENGTNGYNIDMPGGPAREENTFTDVDFGNTQASTTPETFTVTDVKYIDGVRATAENADNTAFHMTATWRADNIGNGTGDFDLDADGFNGDPTPYQAITSPMSVGADYRLSENIPTTCNGDNIYALDGFKMGDTEAGALSGPLMASTTGNIHNLHHNKYLLVMNRSCVLGTTTPSSISGSVFNDTNRNGSKDVNEPGLPNWTISLFKNGNLVTTASTISGGTYTFGNLANGTYQVCQTPKKNWDELMPASGFSCSNGSLGYEYSVNGNNVTGVMFGNNPGNSNKVAPAAR